MWLSELHPRFSLIGRSVSIALVQCTLKLQMRNTFVEEFQRLLKNTFKLAVIQLWNKLYGQYSVASDILNKYIFSHIMWSLSVELTCLSVNIKRNQVESKINSLLFQIWNFTRLSTMFVSNDNKTLSHLQFLSNRLLFKRFLICVHTPHRSQYAAITLTTSCTASIYLLLTKCVIIS